MSAENPAQLIATTAAPAASAAGTPWLRTIGIVVAGSAFVAACAHVALPLYFTPVPLTLQPFAVLLLGLLLAPRLAGTTLLAYLAEGAAGLPVFSPGPASPAAGLAHLFGPTGGYLLAYPAAAMLISWLWRRSNRSFLTAVASAAAGNAFVLLGGAAWLGVLTHAPAQGLLTQSIVPFLPGDALKVIAAAALAAGWLRVRGRLTPSQSTL
jgi:biotin transport system substrate-specific component